MVVLHCYICEYEFSERDFIERLACPICHGGFIEEIRHEGGDGGDEGDDFFEELGREEGDEGDDYSRAGEVPLHQMSPIPRAHLMETMNDGPPPSYSSDPMVLVRGSQCAISAGGLRRRSQGHGHMEDYCHGQLIPHMDSGSQNDMTRCRTPAAYSAVVPTVEITQWLPSWLQ